MFFSKGSGAFVSFTLHSSHPLQNTFIASELYIWRASQEIVAQYIVCVYIHSQQESFRLLAVASLIAACPRTRLLKLAHRHNFTASSCVLSVNL